MRVLFLTFLAQAFLTFAAPISVQNTSVDTVTGNIMPSITSVVLATASLNAAASPSASLLSTDSTEGVHDENESGEDTENEDEDEPDEDENEANEDENEADEESEDEDEPDEEEEDNDCEDGEGGGVHDQRAHEKFRVEIDIDSKTSVPFLSTFLQPADAHLDVKIELDEAKIGSLLTILLGDLNRVLDDAADLVGSHASGGVGSGYINGSPHNSTFVTQASRQITPATDSVSGAGGKITFRARTCLHEKDGNN